MRRVPRGGEGRLGCALWILVLGALVYVAWLALPVKIASAELLDYMEEQAKFASSADEQVLATRILRRAKDLDLPVTKKNLLVEKSGGRIRMECDYTVPLKFPGYTYNWNFSLKVDRPFFIV